MTQEQIEQAAAEYAQTVADKSKDDLNLRMSQNALNHIAKKALFLVRNTASQK